MTQPITARNKQRSSLCQRWPWKLWGTSEATRWVAHEAPLPYLEVDVPCPSTHRAVHDPRLFLPSCRGSGSSQPFALLLAGQAARLAAAGAQQGVPGSPGRRLLRVRLLLHTHVPAWRRTAQAVLQCRQGRGWAGLHRPWAVPMKVQLTRALCILVFHKSCSGGIGGWQSTWNCWEPLERQAGSQLLLHRHGTEVEQSFVLRISI